MRKHFRFFFKQTKMATYFKSLVNRYQVYNFLTYVGSLLYKSTYITSSLTQTRTFFLSHFYKIISMGNNIYLNIKLIWPSKLRTQILKECLSQSKLGILFLVTHGLFTFNHACQRDTTIIYLNSVIFSIVIIIHECHQGTKHNYNSQSNFVLLQNNSKQQVD